jgi:hypothetical protein
MAEDLAAQLADSEEAFRSQFNRESESFHHGDPTPVPVGGERVPVSMPTEYDPSAYPVEEIPLPPEYYHVQDARQLLNTLKSVLSSICPCHEAILRAYTIKDEAAKDIAMAENHEKLRAVFETLSNLKLELIARSALLPQTYEETIVAIIEQGSQDFRDKAVYTDYMFIVKQASAKVFKDMKTLLEQMKTIKKQAR